MKVSFKQYRELLVTYLSPLRAKVLLLTLLVFTGIGLQIVNPQIIRLFIDTVIIGGVYLQLSFVVALLLLAALTFLGVSLLQQIVGIAATYASEDVGWRATNQLRTDLARHCFRLDMSFHNVHTPGEMIERIDGDVGNIANFFSMFVIRILGNLLLLIGVLIMLARFDWRISVTLIVYNSIAMVGLMYLRNIAVPYWEASRQAGAEFFGFLEEQLSGTEDIRSSGAAPYVLRALLWLNKARMGKDVKSATVNTLLGLVWTGLSTVGQVVAFFFSYYLLRAGEVSVGSVFAIVYYTNLVFGPLATISGEIQGLQQVTASIGRVATLFGIQSKIQDAPDSKSLPTGPLAVEFTDVTFGYNETESVLQNISFSLQPGNVLGLLGRTGSGKTTLARLLFRLYDPAVGAIHLGVNGARVDIREIELNDLRQHIGMVTQNVQLFQATVRDNLTFFDKSISDDRVLQAIEEVGLSSWYAALPEGLDTRLETEGSNLSAGEAQLLAFTRVFLNDPGLVILDEASSRLDPATEQLIESAMDRLFRGRTGIVVAHRLRTVQRADQVMIIEGGRIQEFGDYSDLARNPESYFYRLLQTGLEEMLA